MATSLKPAFAGFERKAWIRFFIALAGLSLAFAAAVFSTVSRESGNLWATAILASTALLLAGAVGLTIVPYLARRVGIARVREAFDYDVTREGVAYMLTTLVIGVAALNTGNNLLFIVLSAMLAAILVSGIASAAVLRSLELQVNLPEHIFAGRGVVSRLTLRNTRRLLPSFSVSVAPPREKKTVRRLSWERTIFTFPAKRPPERQWVRLPDFALRLLSERASDAAIFSGQIYFPYLAPAGSATADVELQFARRGRYVQKTLGLATRFPFSFLVKTRPIQFTREDERKLRIVFDNSAPGAVSVGAYENALALAASLGWHFAGEDTDLGFAAPDFSATGDIYEFLRYLALVEPKEGASILDSLAVTDDYNIILTTRARGSIPTGLWASSYFLFMENGAGD